MFGRSTGQLRPTSNKMGSGAYGPSRRRLLIAVLTLALAAPAFAKKPPPPPPPPPPLPPLVLDAAAPIITVEIAGQPVRLRVDPGSTRFVELNASAAKRLDLANPNRLVGEQPADIGTTRTEVGKVTVAQQTSEELIAYEGRLLPLSVAWGKGDDIAGADGTILPTMLPQDEVRFVLRQAGPGDVTAALPLRWVGARGLLAGIPAGKHAVDVTFSLITPQSVTTAAAAAWLAESNRGKLVGPVRQALIMHGISRPVRTLAFERPVAVGPLRLPQVAARIFDWSGKSTIPAEAIPDEELVVPGRVEAQKSWAKLAIGRDYLDSCAEIVWRRIPLEIALTCPGTR
jgi:hypothetical protein